MKWIPLKHRLPPDEQFVLLTGPSGLRGKPSFVVVGRRHEDYRPRLADGEIRWLGLDNSALTDEGFTPLFWAELDEAQLPHPDEADLFRETGLFWEVDTAEAGKQWVEAADLDDALSLTGTWATGFTATGRTWSAVETAINSVHTCTHPVADQCECKGSCSCHHPVTTEHPIDRYTKVGSDYVRHDGLGFAHGHNETVVAWQDGRSFASEEIVGLFRELTSDASRQGSTPEHATRQALAGRRNLSLFSIPYYMETREVAHRLEHAIPYSEDRAQDVRAARYTQLNDEYEYCCVAWNGVEELAKARWRLINVRSRGCLLERRVRKAGEK